MLHQERDGIAAFAAAEAFYTPFEGDTTNDGVFSLWNGQQAW